MKSVFILTYRWTDSVGEHEDVTETYWNLDEAEQERDRMVKEEKERAKAFDEGAIGKFTVKIDRYNFDVECSSVTV